MKTKDQIIESLLSYDDGGAIYPEYEVKKAMDEYAAPYKKIADLVSRVFFYGAFIVETPTEAEIEKLLIEVGLWPTTEDEILKRDQ